MNFSTMTTTHILPPNPPDALQAELTRRQEQISFLRNALYRIAKGIEAGHGPLWVEEVALEALARDHRDA